MRTLSWTAYLCTTKEEYADFGINFSYSFKCTEAMLSEYRKQLTHAGKAGYIIPDNPIGYLNDCLQLSYKE
jgi:hypothetical protein